MAHHVGQSLHAGVQGSYGFLQHPVGAPATLREVAADLVVGEVGGEEGSIAVQ